jgi:hypothetical protein
MAKPTAESSAAAVVPMAPGRRKLVEREGLAAVVAVQQERGQANQRALQAALVTCSS